MNRLEYLTGKFSITVGLLEPLYNVIKKVLFIIIFPGRLLDVFGRYLISFLKHREYGIQKNLDISISQNSVEKNLFLILEMSMTENERGKERQGQGRHESSAFQPFSPM